MAYKFKNVVPGTFHNARQVTKNIQFSRKDSESNDTNQVLDVLNINTINTQFGKRDGAPNQFDNSRLRNQQLQFNSVQAREKFIASDQILSEMISP